MKQVLFSRFYFFRRIASGLLPLLFLLNVKVSGQDLPSSAKSIVMQSIENWNSFYGKNVKATGWNYVGTIKDEQQRVSVVNEITNPQKAWLPEGDFTKPGEVTAGMLSNDPSLNAADKAAWKNKVDKMVKAGQHLARIKWMKASVSFTTLCVTDNTTIVYDDMFSNCATVDHHSKCFDYHIGWIWQSKFEDMTRGKIWANLEVLCDPSGKVLECLPDCGGDMTLGEASCVCVTKIVGNCCVMSYQWAWACGLKKLKFSLDVKGVKIGVDVEGILGSSGKGNGACAACCPNTNLSTSNARIIPANNESYRVQDSSRSNIRTISVSTISGEVVDVRVPNKIQPGDHITGSLLTKNQSSKLQGTVVDVQDKKTSLSDKIFSFAVPLGLSAIPLILKNEKGETIANTSIPVNTIQLPSDANNVPIPADQFQFPSLPPSGNFEPLNYAQPGQPLTINGNFDGNAENTKVSINNIPCEIIAESPRGSFIMVPEGLNAGIATISISNGGVTKSMPIHIVTVNLSTNARTIARNSRATINCTVNGLSDLDLNKNNFRVELTNESPQTISFQGTSPTLFTHDLTMSNTQNGSANFSVEARGINSGSYTVSGFLSSTTCQSCWGAYMDCLDKADAAEKKCIADCNANKGGWPCILACWAVARAEEAACLKEYLKCLEEKFGY